MKAPCDKESITDYTGAAILFGRSMTYRFAFAAFWAAAALAKVDLDAPLNLSVVKGLLLRHLRWWADKDRADMFHADGTLTIGFTYPNMYMAEDYNSPQSPYWCLKSFVILALPETDDFWTVEKEAYLDFSPWSGEESVALEATVVWPPRHIIVNDAYHHYLLSSGQSTTKPFKGREAKYGKFAYSSAFGFSVPTGTLLHQTAPDSTLAVQFGDDLWRARSAPQDVRLEKISVGEGNKHVTGLTSTWRPRCHLEDFQIETTLIPPTSSLLGWHVRVHRISGASGGRDIETVSLVDGGFAIASSAQDGRFIPELRDGEWDRDGWIANSSADGGGALVTSWAGASGIVDLTDGLAEPDNGYRSLLLSSGTGVVRPDPNTNLMASRTLLPLIRHELEFSSGTRCKVLVTAVFAVKADERLHDRDDVRELWRRRPRVKMDGEGKLQVFAVGDQEALQA